MGLQSISAPQIKVFIIPQSPWGQRGYLNSFSARQHPAALEDRFPLPLCSEHSGKLFVSNYVLSWLSSQYLSLTSLTGCPQSFRSLREEVRLAGHFLPVFSWLQASVPPTKPRCWEGLLNYKIFTASSCSMLCRPRRQGTLLETLELGSGRVPGRSRECHGSPSLCYR